MRILAHLDDVGSSHGSVVAWQALRGAGVVRSASLMVPCPWYPLARDDWGTDPAQDMGVHITLTSEWSAYRWRPMIGPKGGLVDDEGFMHRRPGDVLRRADPAAVADEIEAQIARALADGIRPTHLDAHMGTALLDPFVWSLIEAGKRHDIPVLACRDLTPLIRDVQVTGFDPGYIAEVTAEVARQGWPVFDRFAIGFCPDNMEMRPFLERLITEAGDGLIYYGMHADTALGMDAFAPHHAAPRRKEYELFRDPASADIFRAAGAELVSWTDLA